MNNVYAITRGGTQSMHSVCTVLWFGHLCNYSGWLLDCVLSRCNYLLIRIYDAHYISL